MENSDADPIPGVFSTAYWVATVLRIQGYKVLQLLALYHLAQLLTTSSTTWPSS